MSFGPPARGGVLRGCLAALAMLCFAEPAAAAGRMLTAEPLGDQKLRIDGVLKEWPGRMTSLGDTLRGKASENDAKVTGQLAYDDNNIYLAFDVVDDKLVRTRAASDGEDHAQLLIAFPKGGGFHTYEVSLHPGDPGKLPGAVKLGGRPVAGAKIVEAPDEGGYTIEAQIPWKTFGEASTTRVGLRAALRYVDADAPASVRAVVGTSSGGGGRALPALPLEAEQALDATLVRQKNVADRPIASTYGNVWGDKMLERVAVYGGYLTIVGPNYRGGKEFYFAELGVTTPRLFRKLDVRDLDGDGLEEIVVRKKIGVSDAYREILDVLKVGENGQPYSVFMHEVAIKTKDGSIENEVDFVKRGKAYAIRVSQGKADGFEPDTYAESQPDNMPSALLPWETVKSRTYASEGKAFEKIDEDTWTPKVTKGSPSSKAGKPRSKRPAAEQGPPPPPAPRPPTSDELQDRLYALYRKERKVGKGRPRFDFVTDVAGDPRPERVLIHGKDIVVFGKGFRDGTSYAFINVGVAEPKHILDATARDLTGDGKAEILVRGVLEAKASKELGGDVVERHALFIYQVGDDGIRRVFAAETGRVVGENAILGAVAFEPSKRGMNIELRAAHAVGWSERDYPFPPDSTTAGGLEPLLLPWSGGKRRYRWNGQSYALE